MKGRKPKPHLLKVAEGFRGHRPSIPGIEPPAGPFDPPFELTGFARSEWDRLIAECYWLRASEAHALADRCLCALRLRDAEVDIEKRGANIRSQDADGNESEYLNPNVSVAAKYRPLLMKYESEMCLTVASRQRAHGAEQAKQMDSIESALCG